MSQEWIFQTLSAYAYEPLLVYTLVFLMMMASGFGLPIPEEVTIISVGLLAFMAANPDKFPPPPDAGRPIHGEEAAILLTLFIMAADFLVFMIGRKFGRAIMNYPRWKEAFGNKVMAKINGMCDKYGPAATFIFRFTPGIRFPAHIALGMSDLPAWKFVTVDGLACLISVPTQVLLIYHYGEAILDIMQRFKFVIFGLMGLALVIFLARRFWLKRAQTV